MIISEDYTLFSLLQKSTAIMFWIKLCFAWCNLFSLLGQRSTTDLSRYNRPCGVFVYFGFLFRYKQRIQVLFHYLWFLGTGYLWVRFLSKPEFQLSWVVYLRCCRFMDLYIHGFSFFLSCFESVLFSLLSILYSFVLRIIWRKKKSNI